MFSIYYTSPESLTVFDALYNNKHGLQDKFIAYWEKTSARFSKNKYVVGFDPLNEPYPGNNFANIGLNKPGVVDETLLQPMYAKIFEKYQAAGGNNAMWFEPVQVPDEIPSPDGEHGGWQFPVGFTTPPGADIGSNKHVLNDHTYCCVLNPKICAEGEPDLAYASKCEDWHNSRFEQRYADAQRLEVPFFLSEFGACLTEGPCTQEITQVFDAADKYLAGWAYWQFKFFEDLTTSAGEGAEGFYEHDGTLQNWKVKALARSYLMSTQGTPKEMEFSSTSHNFTGRYRLDKAVKGATVAYLNKEHWYPSGYDYTVQVDSADVPTDKYTVDVTDPQQLTIMFPADTEFDGKDVTIHVTPKSANEMLILQ